MRGLHALLQGHGRLGAVGSDQRIVREMSGTQVMNVIVVKASDLESVKDANRTSRPSPYGEAGYRVMRPITK
jgi:hypothetical protein